MGPFQDFQVPIASCFIARTSIPTTSVGAETLQHFQVSILSSNGASFTIATVFRDKLERSPRAAEGRLDSCHEGQIIVAQIVAVDVIKPTLLFRESE
jgi:hypothetical protein